MTQPLPVVLDTNAILMPFTEGARLEELLEELLDAPYAMHVPTSVLSELKNLMKNRGELGRAAKMAVKFSERCASEPTGRMGDDGILEVARRLGGIVLTNDKKLQAECQKSGLRVIVARQQGRLAFLKAGSGGRSD
ncbi:MAG: PIN domain-containing protein [bacterium]